MQNKLYVGMAVIVSVFTLTLTLPSHRQRSIEKDRVQLFAKFRKVSKEQFAVINNCFNVEAQSPDESTGKLTVIIPSPNAKLQLLIEDLSNSDLYQFGDLAVRVVPVLPKNAPASELAIKIYSANTEQGFKAITELTNKPKACLPLLKSMWEKVPAAKRAKIEADLNANTERVKLLPQDFIMLEYIGERVNIESSTNFAFVINFDNIRSR